MPDSDALRPLTHLAVSLLSRAHVPYSNRPAAVVLFDAAGRWVPGVRVENASFSLSIPALRNALTTADALRFGPIAAVACSEPLKIADEIELRDAVGVPVERVSLAVWSTGGPLPSPATEPVSPFLDARPIADPAAGVALATDVAARAVVPASNFPVGCVAQLADGRLVPGVNVERTDWQHILCAERNALGTLVSYGLGTAETLFVTCLRHDCSPCGACRQVITELAPEARIWMPRNGSPFPTTAEALLPERFTERMLPR